jgi:hypothetical protein
MYIFLLFVKETLMLLHSNPDPDLGWAGQKVADIIRELGRIKEKSKRNASIKSELLSRRS